jgi:molecular chaperone GrpE
VAEETVKATEEAVSEEEKGEEAAEEGRELEALRQRLAEAEAKVEDYLDQWRRAAADLANYRKRVEKEQAEFSRYANAALITRILPLLDDFQRAFRTVPDNLRGLTWMDGVALIYRRLQAILEAEGLTLMETEGQSFDPLLHEAVTYEESEEHEEGQIIGEVQRGYKLGDRVLRPALVRVAKGKPVSEAEPD